MSIIVNGKLTIPLYHGTSDLFYESIRQVGLGGRNLIRKLRVVELLRELITFCETKLPNEEQWLLRMQAAGWIARQHVSRGGLNFRHGSVYLTPSHYTATVYATSSKYGSEALGHFMMLWNRLRENQINLPPDISDGAQLIIDFADRPRVPILIKVVGVPETILAAEKGGPASDVFERIEQLGQKSSVSTMCQQENFELLEPIPIHHAEIYRIVKPSRNPDEEPLLATYRTDWRTAGIDEN
jgi:hypothetical protein